MTKAIAVPPRSNRTISRTSHLRADKSKKSDESVDIKFNLNNLPKVDRIKTASIKKGIHQIILKKDTKQGKKESL